MRMWGAELWFLWRDRAAVFWLILAATVTTAGVVAGWLEVRTQRTTVERLVRADEAERQVVVGAQTDWGSAAYYTFHLTYDPPSSLAFAALGQRDVAPWKHRIRMLALEGQIYETDAENPTFALVGRFDFAFVASLLLPLFVVFLLHALRSSERAAGRFELLLATAAQPGRPWMARATVRMGALTLCVVTPLMVVGFAESADGSDLGFVGLAVLLHVGFWWMLCEVVDRNAASSASSLTVLVGLWFGLAVVAPAVIKVTVEQAVPVPEGGDILMAQREAVNDAWDLPKSATMTPFIERHPEWRDHADVKRPFEWKWYYAFQQVGDQSVEKMSQRYRSGRRRRDDLTGWLSVVSPPAWLERSLQTLAKTDVEATLGYEASVRAFHAELREFYYPRLFERPPFEPSALRSLPRFTSRHRP